MARQRTAAARCAGPVTAAAPRRSATHGGGASVVAARRRSICNSGPWVIRITRSSGRSGRRARRPRGGTVILGANHTPAKPIAFAGNVQVGVTATAATIPVRSAGGDGEAAAAPCEADGKGEQWGRGECFRQHVGE